MKKILPLLPYCILFLIPTVTSSQNLIGKEKDIQAILANVQKFSESVMASNYEEIGNAYTLDAKILPTGLDIIQGRKAITKYWTRPAGSTTKYHKVHPEEIKVRGDEAYDYGYYEGITLFANGKESAWRGKYVIVWKKVHGDWKIYLDIWNTIDK